MPAQSDHPRPNPDALLAGMDREQRGGLKIFLGAAPGVGKTYAMLLAAREAQKEGRDIVISVVEAHGRAETEGLCADLERVPMQSVPYREREFAEFDLQATIERKPDVVLVDELAHRNIPGTRHPRRYQDIEDLLDNGIEVWTTLNVQHLESLNDSIARITGVRMRETVPDSILERARDIVLIDLSPRELIERLHQGKVYVPEQARAALDNFFSISNITALREMAFSAAANRVDADLRQAMQQQGEQGPWPARDRLVIAIDGRRNSEQVVRAGKRLAERLQAPWTVVYVDTGRVRYAAAQEQIDRAFSLAERLGGNTAVLRGNAIDKELVAFATDQNATILMLGRTRERLWAGILGQTLTQKLLRHNRDFEVMVVGGEAEPPPAARRRWEQLKEEMRLTAARHYAFALAVVAVCVSVSLGLERLLPLPLANLSLVFLTGVLVVAARTSLVPALTASAVSFLAYNFFFTEPRLTFAMVPQAEIVTVVFFLIMAVIGGNLADQLRRQLAALRATNEQTRIMLSLSQKLASAPDPAAVHEIAVDAIARLQHVPTCFVVEDDTDNDLHITVSEPEGTQLDAKDHAAAGWALRHRKASGHGTDTLTKVPWRFIPLVDENASHGVLGVRLADRPLGAGGEELRMLDALVHPITLALARTALNANLEQARVAEETERLRSALLSSVSHDLRTPLSSIIGAASTLRDCETELTADNRRELIGSVVEEGQRLNRYIGNLLDMTRLGHGGMKLQRDWVALGDLVAAALRRTHDLFSSVNITRSIPTDLPLLYVHPALIEQVLVNVLENAARFSPLDGEVRIAARQDNEDLLVEITDQGCGIPPQDRTRIFDMFTSGEGSDTERHGSGLGLAICHGMVGAHGGVIEAQEGPGGLGTTIAIRLPLFDPPETLDDTVNNDDA
ncbi:sensor histidine kinase KdpD [Salinisphaera sp. USBA-960]|nr:sensor histidine kinase KdpD [Salifodinibacter halophilus]NNC27025.1 sensor histidine kinase KdpD [Salifodinibacter halophilus]